jgi:hypothetical protein
MAIAQQQLLNASVSLFFDPFFVETGGALGDEGSEVKAFLEADGHTVTTFVGTDTAAWIAATSDADIVVIPETGNTVVPLTLSNGAMFFLRQFLVAGGTLIVDGHDADNVALMHQLFGDLRFGPTLTEVDSTTASIATAGVAGTIYSTGALSLPDNSSTSALLASSLPTFAVSLYENAAGDSTVAGFHYGRGQIIWLGWDWNNALPAPGAQDGGWNDVLHHSISLTNLRPNGASKTGNKNDNSLSTTIRDDVAFGKNGDDSLIGAGGHDFLNGGKGNDRIRGNQGNDILIGGKGKDKLTGDQDSDYFVFDQNAGKADADLIRFFHDGEDLLVLRSSRFPEFTPGDMSAEDFAAFIDYKPSGVLKYEGRIFAKLNSGSFDIDQNDFIVM